MFPKHFRYNQLEHKSYVELFSNRGMMKEKSEKNDSALLAKKEKLFKDKSY
jgi:hypothetical protein